MSELLELIYIGTEPPENMQAVSLSGPDKCWVSKAVPLIRVTNGDDPLGYLIGYPIALDRGELLDTSFDLSTCSPASDDLPEALFQALGGKFLFVLDHEGDRGVYPDATASIGLVYDPARRCAASTASSILTEAYRDRIRHDLVAAFGAGSDGWFTAGLTAHDGILRLLPNHRLDLNTWQSERFWPKQMPEYVADPDPVVKAIADELETVIDALAANNTCVQALTGGNESRALLACNRSSRDRVTFITNAVPGAERDLELAQRLVKLARIRHRIVPGLRATPAEIEIWLTGAGHAQSGMNALFYPTMNEFTGQFFIGGLGGEIGRGFLWTADLRSDQTIDAPFVLTQLKLPQHPLLMTAVNAWIAGLPEGLDAFQKLDLAYLELRMGPWGYGQPVLANAPIDFAPLTSRRQYVRMYSLPPSFRRRPGFVTRLIEHRDKQLLTVPINRYGDWRDKFDPVKRVIHRPDRAWRKIKQIAKRKLLSS